MRTRLHTTNYKDIKCGECGELASNLYGTFANARQAISIARNGLWEAHDGKNLCPYCLRRYKEVTE